MVTPKRRSVIGALSLLTLLLLVLSSCDATWEDWCEEYGRRHTRIDIYNQEGKLINFFEKNERICVKRRGDRDGQPTN